MTISFYVAVVLHPLPGKPGNPRPHSSTTWVSCHISKIRVVFCKDVLAFLVSFCPAAEA